MAWWSSCHRNRLLPRPSPPRIRDERKPDRPTDCPLPLDRPEDEEGDIDQCRRRKRPRAMKNHQTRWLHLRWTQRASGSRRQRPPDEPAVQASRDVRPRIDNPIGPTCANGTRNAHQTLHHDPRAPNHRQRQEEHVRESGCPPSGRRRWPRHRRDMPALGHRSQRSPAGSRPGDTLREGPDHDRRAWPGPG